MNPADTALRAIRPARGRGQHFVRVATGLAFLTMAVVASTVVFAHADVPDASAPHADDSTGARTAAALSCEVVRELDRQTAERAAAGVPIPGIEQWPPIEAGTDPNQPPPAVAPAAPDALVYQRPCGAVVDEFRAQAEASTSGTVCYLPDGRFGTYLLVDFVPEAVDGSYDRRPPQEAFDAVCRSLGWDRSVQ